MITNIADIGGYGLNLIISSYCNRKCNYCFQNDHEANFMNMETLENILTNVDSNFNNNIILFGGEPMSNPLFYNIINRLKPYKVKLTTNGSYLYRYIDIDSVVISIEATAKLCKEIRRIDDIAKFITNIYNMYNGSKTKVSFSIVIHDRIEDLNEMFQIIDYIKSLGMYVNILENLGNNYNWSNNEDWFNFTKKLAEYDLSIYKEYIGYDESFVIGLKEVNNNQYLYNLDGAYLTFKPNGNIIPFDMNFDDVIGNFAFNYTDIMNKILNNYYIAKCPGCIIPNKELCSLHPGVYKNIKDKRMMCERQKLMYMMKLELLHNKEPLCEFREE